MSVQNGLSARDAKHPVDEAIIAGNAVMLFQPVIATGGTIAFHEGLLRLTGPDGLIAPGTFLPRAEAAGLLAEMDALALKRVIDLIDGTETLRCSVNMHPTSLTSPLIRVVLAALPMRLSDRLIIEVTEHVSLTDAHRSALRGFRRQGLCVMCDDFGAGATCLRDLLEGCFDAVKLDMALTRGIEADPARQSVYSALRRLTRDFDLMLIAEGVETDAEADWLTQAGIDAMQGFRIGRPVPRPAAAAPFLRGVD